MGFKEAAKPYHRSRRNSELLNLRSRAESIACREYDNNINMRYFDESGT